MRVWALNLPQFYETEENNKWWGKGFTEWSSVRKAVPLYPGHIQPIHPYNDYYYDLSKKESIKWQADIANKYGVEAFVYYHYWYSGKHLLEKPCEILLQSPDINIKYCFCWANHSWTRAWDGKDHEILMKQEYGEKDEWEAHFQYLLPFFMDKRYVKIDNKPVFFIYNTSAITNAYDRIKYLNERLIEEGFSGLYVVENINQFNRKPSVSLSQAVFEDEPSYCCRYKISILNKAKRFLCKKFKITDYQNYDELWNLIIKKRETYDGRRIFLGGFPCWDNSPRKGKNSRIIKGSTPEKFNEYLKKLKEAEKKRRDSSGILVINAWNEWGEGAILEPTKEHGFAYLEAIKNVFKGEENE